MRKIKNEYEVSNMGHPPGFCGLCWKFTEEKMSGVEVKKRSVNRRRKHGNNFDTTINRLDTSSLSISAAKRILEGFIEESKSADSQFTLEELLYSYIPAYDYQLILKNGLDCTGTKDNLLEEIEKEWINREWYSRIYPLFFSNEDGVGADLNSARKINVKLRKRALGDYMTVPLNPSKSFCPDHNPNRSLKSRRCYQNDRKRIIDYEQEINKLYNALPNPWILKDSEMELQSLLKIAYDNTCSSTLNKIMRFKDDGMNQTEIANILNISRQAVSIALRRTKTKGSPVSKSKRVK